ncbi:MAG: hypothetical protein AB1757_18835 [Acidobacteriota bacterium]
MYCSTCGNRLIQGLKYCNQCGAKIENNPEDKSSGNTDKIVGRLSFAMIWVALFGFIATFLVVENLVKTGSPAGMLASVLFFLLGTVFGISYLLIREISKTLEFNRQMILRARDKPVAVRDTAPQQIEAPKEVISVTENTTRNFEPAYGEKNSP